MKLENSMISRARFGHRRSPWLAGAAVAAALLLAAVAPTISSVPDGKAASTANAVPAPIAASSPSPPTDGWAMLTQREQATLKPLQPHWADLDAQAKARWIQVADRLQGKPSRAGARAAEHMEAWQRMSSAKRAQARLHFVMASRLSPAERRQRWAAYRAQHGRESPAASPSGSMYTMVSPASARARQGATSLLVTDLRPDVLPAMRAVQSAASASEATPASNDAS